MIHTETPHSVTSHRRKRWVIPTSILGVAVVVIAGGLLWFFGGDPPPEVDLAATASSVAGDSELTATGIEGSWEVDTSVGEFTLEETTTASFLGFRVDEVLNSIGSTTAVGRTPDVTGTITVQGTTLSAAEISGDLTAIVSDESRREDSIQRSLNTSTNPSATFVLTEPIDLGSAATEGEVVSVAAIGDLTINGITNQVEVDLEAQLVDGLILVTGSTDVVFADYGIAAPSSPAVLSVEDHGTVEIQLWLSR